MLVHQGDELMKKLVRTVAAFDLFMGEKVVHFVVYIEQEALQVVRAIWLRKRWSVSAKMAPVACRRPLMGAVNSGGSV